MARDLDLLEQSQKRNKIGANKPFATIELGVDDVECPVVSANLTYTLDGTSGLRFVTARQLSGWENNNVKLRIGYGSTHVRYFHGRLAEVKDHPSGLSSEGVAYGITEQMGTRYFLERVSYKGATLEQAYFDIMDRAQIHPDSWQINNGDEHVIEEDHDILPETSFLEGLAMLIEPFHMAQYDIPSEGPRAIHLVRPKPEFGYWKDLVGVWNERHYLMNTFNFKPGLKEFYRKVVVFRRGENTTTDSTPEGPDTPLRYEVYAEHEVEPQNLWHAQPVHTRVFFVPDFFGGQSHAERIAEKWAKVLQTGAGTFELEIPPCDLRINDAIGVRQRERVTSNRLTKLLEEINPDTDVDVGDVVSWFYVCLIENIELELGPGIFTMRLSGRGIKRRYSVVRASRFKDVINVNQGPLEPGVAPPASPDGGFLTWGDTSPEFDDLTTPFSELT